MINRRSALLAAVVAVVMRPSIAIAANPQVTVTGVRHWTDDARTRIVIDLSRELPKRAPFKVSEATAPDRIVINIPRGTIGVKGDVVAIGSGAVKRVRLNKIRTGAQVVIDLARRTKYTHDYLPASPRDGRPARIVIDVVETGRPGAKTGTPVAGVRLPEPSAALVQPAGKLNPDSLPVAGTDTLPVPVTAVAPRPPGKVVVVIDAGHGGDDPGARGPRGIREKTITLRVAQELYERLSREPGIEARLTRSDDRSLTLDRRQDLARELGADIFVSVHANSSPNKKARGAEIFYISNQAAERSAELERRRLDNAADLDRVLADLAHQEAMMLSARLAGAVARGIDADSPVELRKVMQAGFQVLKLNGIPAILVEVGFLSNAAEAKALTGPKFADRMAQAIADAVRDFSRQGLLARPSVVRRELARSAG